jgi:lipoyl-dependent peroxiredoxin
MILRQAVARARMPTRVFGAGLSRIGSVRTIMEPSQIQVRSYLIHTPSPSSDIYSPFFRTKYTASATASGAGRAGKVAVSSAVPPLASPFGLALPKSMGGDGKGVNPEQLFSAGYSACYLGALHACARKVGKKIDGAEVEVRTSIGPTDGDPGFALVVELLVKGVNDQSIVDAAHNVRILSSELGPVLTLRDPDVPLFPRSEAWDQVHH